MLSFLFLHNIVKEWCSHLQVVKLDYRGQTYISGLRSDIDIAFEEHIAANIVVLMNPNTYHDHQTLLRI